MRRRLRRPKVRITLRIGGAPWGETVQELSVSIPSTVYLDIDHGKGRQTIELRVDENGATISGGG
jgi:hypothetical protein